MLKWTSISSNVLYNSHQPYQNRPQNISDKHPFIEIDKIIQTGDTSDGF